MNRKFEFIIYCADAVLSVYCSTVCEQSARNFWVVVSLVSVLLAIKYYYLWQDDVRDEALNHIKSLLKQIEDGTK